MPVLELDEGEREVFNQRSGEQQYLFAVTDRAIFLPTKKRGLVTGSPWATLRVPVSNVLNVELSVVRPYAIWVLSLLLIAIGLFTTVSMFVPSWAESGQRVSGYPFAILVAGLLLPFISRGRLRLRVETTTGARQWKSPLHVDARSRNVVKGTFRSFHKACSIVGIPLKGEHSA